MKLELAPNWPVRCESYFILSWTAIRRRWRRRAVACVGVRLNNPAAVPRRAGSKQLRERARRAHPKQKRTGAGVVKLGLEPEADDCTKGFGSSHVESNLHQKKAVPQLRLRARSGTPHVLSRRAVAALSARGRRAPAEVLGVWWSVVRPFRFSLLCARMLCAGVHGPLSSCVQ